MTLFVLDDQIGSPVAREWGSMLPPFDEAIVNDGAIWVVRPTGLVNPPKPDKDLLIVHRSSIFTNDDSGNVDPRQEAIKRMGCPILIISGEGQQKPIPGLPAIGGCYYRQAALDTLDAQFKDEFAAFWGKYLSTREVDWAMLEPKASPQSLVAVYLVAKSAQLNLKKRQVIMSGWDKMAKHRKQEVWRQALQEYVGKGGTDKEWTAMGLRDGKCDILDFNDVELDAAVAAIESVLGT